MIKYEKTIKITKKVFLFKFKMLLSQGVIQSALVQAMAW